MSTNKEEFTSDFNAVINNLSATNKAYGESLLLRLNKLKHSEKKYSDVISDGPDGEKLQWVNFVQEGGGTLGISLAGYAFVLEYVGIRFLKLAGTSAGAINTIFLVAIGQKDDPKTPELYNMMTDPKRLDLKSFVDASSVFVRRVLFSLGKGMGLVKNLATAFLVLLILVLLPLPLISHIGVEGKIVYYVFLGLFLLCSAWIGILLFRLGKYNYGINPGEKFTSFLKKELTRFGVSSIAELDKKGKGEGNFEVQRTNGESTKTASSATANVKHVPDGFQQGENHDVSRLSLRLRASVGYVHEKDQHIDPEYRRIEYDYSFVSTDISNNCKVVFPKDADLYFDQVEAVNPAEFIRASMAIPIFFEPQFFPEKPGSGRSCKSISSACRDKWLVRKGIEAKEGTGILIDGGSLSNFPINLFHNPQIRSPRVPIMGVRILDEKPTTTSRSIKRMSLGYYIGNIINTLRSNEDSSFLGANPFYKRFCIAEIKAYDTKINWLDFNLSKKQKDILFTKGVEAALDYLDNFNWEVYKSERAKL